MMMMMILEHVKMSFGKSFSWVGKSIFDERLAKVWKVYPENGERMAKVQLMKGERSPWHICPSADYG